MPEDRAAIIEEARRLLEAQKYGVLSTHSAEVPGYPFGSVVPYALDRAGRAVILISGLAQHTGNIKANPKISLIVLEPGEGNVQRQGRLTYLADAVPVEQPDGEAAARYFERFPEMREFARLDFRFFRLEPVRLRFVAGFGKIYWIEPAEFSAGASVRRKTRNPGSSPSLLSP